ncbi:MAG: hypothetical protein OQL16_01500 [Gammaproteobacteria bacterium]|nr:hypothetical protein [Gammaproteobacteria bacterium]
MAKTIVDIAITGLDDEASSKPDHSLGLYNIVLTLSRPVPYEWADYFNSRWKQHIYMKKRDAYAENDKLTIYCLPEELQGDHIPELKKIIKETNKSYKQFLSSQKLETQRRKQLKKEEKEALSSLKTKLKF